MEETGGKKVNEIDPNQNDECEKCVMVTDSNALVDPLAMMILPIDAFITNVTMPRIPWPQYFAGRADIEGPEVLIQFQKRNIFRRLDNARIPNRGNDEGHELQDKQYRNWIGKVIVIRIRE